MSQNKVRTSLVENRRSFYAAKLQHVTIASVTKKVGSHGDHRGVLLDCQDEKIGYHASKYLSKPSK